MKKIAITFLIFTLFMACVPVRAQEVPHVIRSTQPITEELRTALDAWLAVDPPSSAQYYIVTNVRGQGDATVVSLAGVNLTSAESDWSFEDDPAVWLGSVTVAADGTVSPLVIQSTNIPGFGTLKGMRPLSMPPPYIDASLDDSYSKVLLHLNGSDASTTFTDESGKTWTAAGNSQIDTDQYKFGGASGLFDGSGDFIYTADSSDFAMGSDNFTVDLWMRPAAINQSAYIMAQSASNGANSSLSWYVHIDSDESIAFGVVSGSTIYEALTPAGEYSADTWFHVAGVRDGNTITIYINGTSRGTADVTGVTVNDSPNYLSVGRLGEYNGLYFNGWVDEARVSKGIARWTTAFTPASDEYIPVPTATPTFTPSPTATYTPTPTFTPTSTFTPTVTLTPTITLTPTATFTPSITPTSTVGPTATNTQPAPPPTNTPPAGSGGTLGGGSYLMFPFASGTAAQYGPRGVHAAGYGTSGMQAVDLVGGDAMGSSAMPPKTFAADAGTIDYVCYDGTSIAVRTYNSTTGDYFIYAHMLSNASLVEGHAFTRGAFMGSLKYGTFDDTCGWASQGDNQYHLHWGVAPKGGGFQVGSCILTVSTQKWQCGSNVVTVGGWLTGGGGYTSGQAGGEASGRSGAGETVTDPTFFDYVLTGVLTIVDRGILKLLPSHSAFEYTYVLFNVVTVVLKIIWVLVASNINLYPLMTVIALGIAIKLGFFAAWLAAFLLKAWKSLVPVLGA